MLGEPSSKVPPSNEVRFTRSLPGVEVMKTCGTLIGLALLVGSTGTALAQSAGPEVASDADRSVARQLTVDGLQALEKRDFATAEARFARAASIKSFSVR